MVTTDEVADVLSLTAKLMEVLEENPFKIKSLANAAFRLSKTNIDLSGLSLQELEKIEGIGKSIAGKIVEIRETETTRELQVLLEKTPKGIVEMLSVKGIGPKKIGQLWRELHVESIGELLYACHENRLVDLKGFGAKTQESVMKAIEFKISNNGKYHYATIEANAAKLVEALKQKYNTDKVSLVATLRRKCEIIESIEILVGTENPIETTYSPGINIPLHIIYCKPGEYFYLLVKHSSTEKHLDLIGFNSLTQTDFESEEAVYRAMNLPYIEPELREGFLEVDLARANKLPVLIRFEDLKGSLHNHSKYSDGLNTLEEMAVHCKELGYEYLGICDHSQTAVYANGLKAERVIEQHKEIEKLNIQLAPFKILKGIESDILNDGSLDYPEEVLKTFDFVVASVHQNLKMDEEKATSRLIRAIENPYTSILGHPTGRLLLARPGYPIQHKKVIDACAANGVIIELNAHPYRLDIDWRWIPYCLEKGVNISINPDAHEKQGYHDMYFGVCAARKGMLTKEMCLNTMSLSEIEDFLIKRKVKRAGH
jgi:DNA polymerase (family 10)